jgi:hypothetical protein
MEAKGRALLQDSLPPLDGAAQAAVSSAYGKLPLSFEINQGQTDSQVKFLSRGSGHTLFLTSNEAVWVFPRPAATSAGSARQDAGLVLNMQLIGADPDPLAKGLDELEGKANYFIGNDSREWRSGVPTYTRVRYQSVYPGIDMLYYGKERQLEYDFIVSPGADPGAIRFSLSGMDKLTLDSGGDLVLNTTQGEFRLKKPFVYQECNGTKQPIAGSYALSSPSTEEGASHDAPQVGFQLGAYDVTRPLVIDPLLFYSTYLGGSEIDFGHAIALDPAGNAYVVGQTRSPDFPTKNRTQAMVEGFYAFVAKMNPTGSALLYSTYLGGSGGFDGFDRMAIAVDSFGNAHIAGETNAPDFPTANPIQPALRGGYDAFVLKINSTGSALMYSTFLGGTDDDLGRGIALDPSGSAYVIGITRSADFPTANAMQPALGGGFGYDAFVSKLSAEGSVLFYSTYLGGSTLEFGYDIAVDASGEAYVTGFTSSTDFPTVNPLQRIYGGGTHDCFLAKINATGSSLRYSTYLGGSDDEEGLGIAVDASGSVHVTGWTSSPNFPTVNPIQGPQGPSDAFVAKLGPAGPLIYSTYLGGSQEDSGSDIAIDTLGNAYVTGTTDSPNFPIMYPIQSALGGLQDSFVTKFNLAGSAVLYSTYLGGAGNENPYGTGCGIAVDSSGTAYVAGSTTSSNFPETYGLQPALGGFIDAYVSRISTRTEVFVRLEESAGQNLLTVIFSNGAPIAVPVQLKLWVQSPGIGLASLLGSFVPVLTLAPSGRFYLLSKVPLPSNLPFPGTTVGARLIGPATGLLLGESICSKIPCN